MDYLFKATQKLLLIFGHLARIFFLKIKYQGKDNLKNIKKGPLLIVGNHKSFMDPILIGTCLPFFSNLHPLRFMAKDEFFTNFFNRFIFEIIGSYPAFNGYGIEKSLEMPAKLLGSGGTVVMFPEGRCIRNDYLGNFKIGAGIISSRFPEINILPIAIRNTHKMQERWAAFKKPSIIINIGQPFKIKDRIKEGIINPELSLKIINEEILKLYGNN